MDNATSNPSAAWAIVDVWQNEQDTDGVAFRDKIFAVFPGFEPNLSEGKTGIHLLFLFDPAVGSERYQQLFDQICGRPDTYATEDSKGLQLSTKSPEEAFEALDHFRRSTASEYEVLVLGAHVDSEHGIYKELSKQRLREFPFDRISAIELKDNMTRAQWLQENAGGKSVAVRAGTQAAIHASDAYRLDGGESGNGNGHLGKRFTMVKLGAPTIEALRQAFLASETRQREAFHRNAEPHLVVRPDLPQAVPNDHPWLRRVTVASATGFFSAENAADTAPAFEFSPDLTCIIGGNMSGKSTLLDGLRVRANAPLPADARLAGGVQLRAAKFASAPDQIQLDVVARDAGKRAEYWSQNELRQLAGDAKKTREVLIRFARTRFPKIDEQERRLLELDAELSQLATELPALVTKVASVSQELLNARTSKLRLDEFRQLGLQPLLEAQADRTQLEALEVATAGQVETLASFSLTAKTTTDGWDVLRRRVLDGERPDLDAAAAAYDDAVQTARRRLGELRTLLTAARARTNTAVDTLRARFVEALQQRGYPEALLQEIDRLTREAGLVASWETQERAAKASFEAKKTLFESYESERESLTSAVRASFEVLSHAIAAATGDAVRVTLEPRGDSLALATWLQGLKQAGVTRWAASQTVLPSPTDLLAAIDANQPVTGLSPAVSQTLRQTLDEGKRWALRALRSPDRFALEARLEANEYRRLDELSGGRQASVLLTLLLKIEDGHPLFLDQPEDEVDKQFLAGTIIPALKQLKGRRQVVIATHDANIVVNADADFVLCLEASAKRGRIAAAGTIDELPIRERIVQTLDGGREAFEARLAKYGF